MIAMSAVGAYLMLIAVAIAAGFGGGLAFALLLARGLNRQIDARLQGWITAAGEALDNAPASTRKETL